MIQLKLKRGTDAAVSGYTGPQGELAVGLDTISLRLQDGVQAGGHPIAAGGSSLQAPTMTLPVEGANLVGGPVMEIAPVQLGGELHAWTQWQISDDTGFTNLLMDSGQDRDNILSLDTTTLGFTPPAETTVYFRARVAAGNGSVSEWSATVSAFAALRVPTAIEHTLRHNPPLAYTRFGRRVAINEAGTVMVILLGGNGQTNPPRLVMHRFVEGAWTVDETFMLGSNEFFSNSRRPLVISADGNTVALGRPSTNAQFNTQGAITIYRYDGQWWNEYETIYSPEPWTGGNFGTSLAMTPDGNTIIATGIASDSNGYFKIFGLKYDGGSWNSMGSFIHPYAVNNYANYVCVSSDGTIVSISEEEAENGKGGVSLAHHLGGTTWEDFGRLIAPDAVEGDYNGSVINMSRDGKYIVATAPRWGMAAGKGYVWERSGNVWNLAAELTGSDTTVNTEFYGDVAVSDSGDVIFVGDPAVNDYDGLIYVFTRTGPNAWTQLDKFIQPVTAQSTLGVYFGWTFVATPDGSTLVAGNEYVNVDAVSTAGEVYVYK